MSFELLLLQGTWNFTLLFLMFGIVALYTVMLIRVTSIKPYGKQPLLFYSTCGLVYLVMGTPISAIAHLSFSLHMFQMSILYFIIPPMLMLGIPKTFIKRLPMFMRDRVPVPLSRIALVLFAILFLLYHVPFVLQVFASFVFVQHVYSAILFILAFCMWIPITWPDPDKRLPNAEMKRYALQSGLFIMPACILFIAIAFLQDIENPFITSSAADLCLPSQTSSFRILPTPFNTKYDQVMAGVLMMGVHKTGLVLSFRFHRNQEP